MKKDVWGHPIIPERCAAEIGRPGSYHGCRRVAKHFFRTARGLRLGYCDRHVHLATDPRHVSQPVTAIS